MKRLTKRLATTLRNDDMQLLQDSKRFLSHFYSIIYFDFVFIIIVTQSRTYVITMSDCVVGNKLHMALPLYILNQQDK